MLYKTTIKKADAKFARESQDFRQMLPIPCHFIEMLTESLSMWDVHLGRINAAKHQVQLLKDNTQPIHSAPYRAGQKTREFKKSEFEKMLAQNFASTTEISTI